MLSCQLYALCWAIKLELFTVNPFVESDTMLEAVFCAIDVIKAVMPLLVTLVICRTVTGTVAVYLTSKLERELKPFTDE